MIQGHSLWMFSLQATGPTRIRDFAFLFVILRLCLFSLFYLIWHSRALSILGRFCFKKSSHFIYLSVLLVSGLYICISACILLNSFLLISLGFCPFSFSNLSSRHSLIYSPCLWFINKTVWVYDMASEHDFTACLMRIEIIEFFISNNL